MDDRDVLSSSTLTYGFWIFLIASKSSAEKVQDDLFCPLILKGEDNFTLKKFERYPAVFFGEESRKLRVYASLERTEYFPDVSLATHPNFRESLPKVWELSLCKNGHT